MFGMKGFPTFLVLLIWTGFQWTTGQHLTNDTNKQAPLRQLTALTSSLIYYPNGTVVVRPRSGWR